MFQNTVGQSFASILAAMQSALNNEFESIVEGSIGIGDYPTPSVGIEVLSYEDIGRVDGNKKKRVALKLRTVFSITQSDKTAEALSHTSKIDDFFDTITAPDGVQGFDDIKWSLTLPSGSKPSDNGFADATLSYTVIVPRGDN